MDYSNPYARFGVNMNPIGYQNTPMQAPVPSAVPGTWQQPRQVTRVSGMEGARSYAASMPPNSTDAVFDSDRDVFYFLSTDGGGFPTVRPFSFNPLEESQNGNQKFVTHEELNAALMQLQEMISNAQQPVSSEPTAKPSASRKSSRTAQSD